MAKIVAKNASLYIEDSTGASQAMSGLSNSVTLTYSAETPESTSFGEGTRSRLSGGLLDWSLSFDAFYDTAANKTDAVLSAILGGSTGFKLGPSGSTSTCVMYAACGILSSYEMTLGVADAATVTGTIVARTGSLTRGTWS